MEILENLLRRYFPGKEEPPVQVNMTRVESARFCGSYRVTRASYSTIEKILTLFSSFTVRPGENGRLVVFTVHFHGRYTHPEIGDQR